MKMYIGYIALDKAIPILDSHPFFFFYRKNNNKRLAAFSTVSTVCYIVLLWLMFSMKIKKYK